MKRRTLVLAALVVLAAPTAAFSADHMRFWNQTRFVE